MPTNPLSDAQDLFSALPPLNRLECVDGLSESLPYSRKVGQICVYVNNASLYFEAGDGDDVGDADGAGWDDSATSLNIKVVLEYFDLGAETIRIGYTTDGASETLATIVTKTNTRKWKKAHLVLSGVRFGTSYYGLDSNDVTGGGGDHYNADFRIFSAGALYLSSLALTNRDTKSALRFPAYDYQNQTSTVPDDSLPGTGDEFTDNLFAGWTVSTTQLSADSGSVVLDSSVPSIALGAASGFATGTGIWQGKDSGSYKWRVGNPAGNNARWDGTTFAVTGTITSTAGNIGGWLIGNNTLTSPSGTVVLDSDLKYIAMGLPAPTYIDDPSVGIFMGYDPGYDEYAFRVGSIYGGYISWDGTTLAVKGTIDASSGLIGGWTINSTYLAKNTGIAATSSGMSPTDYPFYAGRTYSNRATAPFRVTPAGALTASNATITGAITATSGTFSGDITVSGNLRNSAGNPRWQLDANGYRQYDSGGTQRSQLLNDGSGWLGSSSVFSWTTAGVVSLNGSAVVGNSLDADKVTFTAPTISGLTLTNNSPSAGHIACSSFKLTYQGVTYTVAAASSNQKYIYWKKSASTTVLQASATIPANAPDMFIVAINFGGSAYQSNFAPFIYADYISVGNLAAINAAMGTLTSGTIVGSRIATSDTGARTELHYNNLFGLGFGGIGGTDGSTTQWYAKASDGILYFGAGNGTLSANGLRFTQGSSGTNSVSWYSGANLVGRAYAVDDGSLFNTLYISGQGVTSTRNGRIYFTATDSAGAVTGLYVVSDNSVQLGNANLVWTSDNAYDLGYYGSTPFRPRNAYIASQVFVNATSNSNMTKGITILQSSDNEIFAAKRNTLAHGMTTLTETDTYFTITPFQTTNGGAGLQGYSASTVGMYLQGLVVTADTARSTSAVGAVIADASKKSGTGKSSMGANGNLFVVRNDASTQFLVDAEGDIHMNATSNINAWDEYDDLALLEAYRVKTAQPSNYRRAFAHDVERYAQILHDTGVLTLNPDGQHFVSMKGLFGLTIDAMRQLALRVDRYERALVALGVNVQALDA